LVDSLEVPVEAVKVEPSASTAALDAEAAPVGEEGAKRKGEAADTAEMPPPKRVKMETKAESDQPIAAAGPIADCAPPSIKIETEGANDAEQGSEVAQNPSPNEADPTPTVVDPSPNEADPTPTAADPSPDEADPTPTAADPSPDEADPTPTAADPSPNAGDIAAVPIKTEPGLETEDAGNEAVEAVEDTAPPRVKIKVEPGLA